ncbi:MAG: hypothetical protein KDD55_03970, partial [Bdellovibrionales bacterium]|nr:hypothetical protein [Bdellovibrionales bacterium]
SPAPVSSLTSIERRADILRERFLKALIAEFRIKGHPTLSHFNGVGERDPLLTHSDQSTKRYTQAMFTSGYQAFLYECTDRERYTFLLIGPDGNVKEKSLSSAERLSQLVSVHIESAGALLEKINAFTKRIYLLADTELAKTYERLAQEYVDSSDSLKCVLSTTAIASRKSEQELYGMKRDILIRRIKERFSSLLGQLYASNKSALSRVCRARKLAELHDNGASSFKRIGKTLSCFLDSRWSEAEFQRVFEDYFASSGERSEQVRAEVFCEMVRGLGFFDSDSSS